MHLNPRPNKLGPLEYYLGGFQEGQKSFNFKPIIGPLLAGVAQQAECLSLSSLPSWLTPSKRLQVDQNKAQTKPLATQAAWKSAPTMDDMKKGHQSQPSTMINLSFDIS